MKKIIIYSAVMMAITAAVYVSPSAYALECSILPKEICDSTSSTQLDENATWKLLLLVLNILTTLVGIVSIAMVVYAGYIYATAADNAGEVKKAKDLLKNITIGIVMYALMYALIQFIVPGGLF